jgi:DNA replication and repair protein RecF
VRLTRLEISGVRNLSRVVIGCSNDLNLFVGANGAGKTAILESIHLLARGRSFRSGAIGSVIQHGASVLHVAADIQDEQRGEVNVRFSKAHSGAVELLINGRAERKISEIARLVPIQVMLPDGSTLVLGAPEERRRYLDWGTFHVEPSYVGTLRGYQRVLQQRNASLRALKVHRSDGVSELDVWTTRLAELGVAVDTMRRRYLVQLLPAIARQIAAMSSDLAVAIMYQPGWPDGQTLAESLRECWSRDVNSAVTSRGPHRAELRLEVGSERASAIISRGQAKIIASAMRLAQAEVTAQFGRRRSVFLIDDIGAELDGTHSERFFAALGRLRCQVFATATEASRRTETFRGDDVRLFHVEQGKCWPQATEEA